MSKTTPTYSQLINQVVDFCALKMPADQAAGKTLTELGLDSLGFVELAMALEDSLQVTLDLDKLSVDMPVADLVKQILADLPGLASADAGGVPQAVVLKPSQAVAQWVQGVSFEVELENFALRSLEPGDVTSDYLAWWNDADIQSRLGMLPRGWGLERARQYVQHFDNRHQLHLGIFDRSNGLLIGFQTITSNPNTRVASTNRVIGNKAYWRRGISRELSAWAVPFIFEQMDMHKISASIHGDNQSSMWLVEFLGFQREGVLREEQPGPHGERLDVCKYGLLREEWRQMVAQGIPPWAEFAR
jgi:diamine N-acetyltransferase